MDLRTYKDWNEFTAAHPNPTNAKYFSTHADKVYLEAGYSRGDFLFFGCETAGLGREFVAERIDRAFRIPIFEPGVRSLNLSNAVSIVVYEALRQTGLLIAQPIR